MTPSRSCRPRARPTPSSRPRPGRAGGRDRAVPAHAALVRGQGAPHPLGGRHRLLPLAGVARAWPARPAARSRGSSSARARARPPPCPSLCFFEGERASAWRPSPRSAKLLGSSAAPEPAVIAEARCSIPTSAAPLPRRAVLRRRCRLRGSDGGSSAGWPAPALRDRPRRRRAPEPSIFRAEQSNTSVLFGQSLILKLFRRLKDGMNPDLELGRPAERASFAHTPRAAGALESEGRRRAGDAGDRPRVRPQRGDAGSTRSTPWGASTRRPPSRSGIRPGRLKPRSWPRGLLERAAAWSRTRSTRRSAPTSSRPSSWAGVSPSCTRR